MLGKEQEAADRGCEGITELAFINVCKGREDAPGREEAWAEPSTFDKHQQFMINTEGATLGDRKSTRLNSSHKHRSRMPSSA